MESKPAAEAAISTHIEENWLEDQKPPTQQSVPPAEFDKILRKIDTRVIPILTILYLLSFLDRG